MNFDGNFRRVGSANVASVQALVEKLSDESWLQDSTESFAAQHDDKIQVVFLVHDDLLRHDQPKQRPALEVFGNVIRPVLAMTAGHFESSPAGQKLTERFGAGYFVRAKLLRVASESSFAAEADSNLSEVHAHRIHLPIITNENTRFTVGDETLTLPSGEIYEINNLRDRQIENDGDIPCVHLVLDYVLDRRLTE